MNKTRVHFRQEIFRKVEGTLTHCLSIKYKDRSERMLFLERRDQ